MIAETPVILFGGTGRVGRSLASVLIEQGRAVRIVTRHAEKARALIGASAEYFEADIRVPTTLQPALEDDQDVFLACGDAPDQEQLEIGVIEQLQKRRVRHVVKLSAHAAGWVPPLSVGILHRNIERTLESSGLNWTHLRPVFFQQTLLMFADEIRSKQSITVPLKNGRVSFLDVRDVADSAASCLGNPEHFNKTYTLTGAESLSITDFARIVEQHTGRRIKLRTLPNWVARIMLPLVAGMPRWQSNLIVDLMAELERDQESEITNDVAALTGQTPRRLTDMVAEHLDAFAAS